MISVEVKVNKKVDCVAISRRKRFNYGEILACKHRQDTVFFKFGTITTCD